MHGIMHGMQHQQTLATQAHAHTAQSPARHAHALKQIRLGQKKKKKKKHTISRGSSPREVAHTRAEDDSASAFGATAR